MNTNTKNIHTRSVEEVLKNLETTKDGLSQEEATKRRKLYGANAVKHKVNLSWLVILWHQFNNALVWILLVAAGLALVFGEFRDTTIILIIVAINATIGFFQEYKAERTLDRIRSLATDKAIVVRDGKRIEVDARELTIGDVIYVAAGSRIGADGYLLEAFDLYVNEFIFTGESKPGRKKLGAIAEENISLVDKDNMIFSGTSVTRGEGRAVVTAIGMDSELGKIANLVTEVKEEETPLQKQIRVLGKDVTILALFIGVLVLIAGAYYQISWYERFLFALALSVSVVPEGLPAAISVALSLGMKKLLKDNVLAKKLNAVETLASVSVICTDKTGTITKNELMVTKIVIDRQAYDVSGDGYEPVGKFSCFGRDVENADMINGEKICRIATLCNDAELAHKDGAWSVVGDPTEGALLVAAQKYSGSLETYAKGFSKLGEIPFSSDRMRMSVIYRNESEDKAYSFVKGSPDILLDMCTMVLRGNDVVPMNEADRAAIRNIYNEMSSKALRVLAFTYRDFDNIAKEEYESNAEKDLVWVGMMAMIDPPRKDVAEAVRQCYESGIKVIMITGDYEITARAIAKQAGLLRNGDGRLISGKELETLTDEDLIKAVKEGEVVFARIAPEQKLRIATVLKANDLVIAMTGDGVNDAPALKKADIGVAMGVIGTDVSKEASDMILLDDNFASIVKVIKEGRTIYQNLKKFVHYVFTSNASEFFTVIIGLLLQIPAPIAAVQILAIDLGTDIFPSFSLSMEPSEPGVMKRKPFNSYERVMDANGAWRLIRIGLIMAVGAVIAFIISMKRGGWDFGDKIETDSLLYIRSTSVAYAVLAMTQMANLLQSRSETLSVFAIGFFKNLYAIGAIIISIGMLLAFMYVPFIQQYLHMSPIMWQDWIAVAIVTCIVFIYEEMRKAGNDEQSEHKPSPK
jgi:Ca2+-transporting ATPase